MQIINVNDDRYVVCGTVLAQKVMHLSTDELKSWYSLADTVLRNGDTFYFCMIPSMLIFVKFRLLLVNIEKLGFKINKSQLSLQFT